MELFDCEWVFSVYYIHIIIKRKPVTLLNKGFEIFCSANKLNFVGLRVNVACGMDHAIACVGRVILSYRDICKGSLQKK